MAYVTTAQLQARLGSALYARLTDRVNGTTADGTVAQQIVEEASAHADGFLAVRYATPVDLMEHPELVMSLSARVLDLAEYLAWRASPFVGDVPERVRLVHIEAQRWLESVAAGRVHLPAAAPPASRVAEDDGPRFRSSRRRFSDGELDGV
jgi:phage gp36-like protein